MNTTNNRRHDAVVIGLSLGGLKALEMILSQLEADFALPVMVVQHRAPDSDDFLSQHIDEVCALHVTDAADKMPIEAGYVYFAPPGYHLQVEPDRTQSLSVDPPIQWSRPSIDVLFETAAEVYRERLVGIVMTGTNTDGSSGLIRIKQLGGCTVVQDPHTAQAPEMPTAAIAAAQPDHILPLESIGGFLASLNSPEPERPLTQ